MNAFDASYFGLRKLHFDTEAQIADPSRDVSVPDFAIEGLLPPSCKPGAGFSSRVSSCSRSGLHSKICTVWKKHERARSFVPVGDCDSLSTLTPCHSLAALLACFLHDRYLLSESVVARASAGIGESADGSQRLDFQ